MACVSRTGSSSLYIYWNCLLLPGNEKLPMGLRIVGPPLGEERALALARQIQQALPIDLLDLTGLSIH